MKRNLNTKVKRAFYPWLAASLLCMVVIFFFSSQNAEESSKYSGGLTRGLFQTIFRWFNIDGTDSLFEMLELIIRKASHLLIFLTLGVCSSSTIRQVTGDRRKVFWISLCWSSFYAATDEFHQYFVPGRACMWQDWLIDTVGALIGIGVAMGVARMRNK